MATKYTKWPQNIPNGHKIDQHLSLQDPLNFTQIGIFGLKKMPFGNRVSNYLQRHNFQSYLDNRLMDITH
jgi:hypothetical protein